MQTMRIALVFIGGLVTATLLTLVVRPAPYKRFSLGRKFDTGDETAPAGQAV